MKNLGQMMKKAQEMQARMAEMQENLSAMQVEGTSGGGMVTVRLSGKFDVLGVSIADEALESDNGELLEDLVAAAFNDAKVKVDAAKKEMTDEMTGGLPLPPGMKLPF
ncbi:MAG: YbaB/EbfC family nucleoid-associated protein [Rhodospirillaceae bacterium]|nr:YbaB/EbfC family nucleoid-associated protein [Rhodospirillaceae bacterium]